MKDLKLNNTPQSTNVRETHQPIDINISVPKAFILDDTKQVSDIGEKLTQLAPQAKQLAHAAFHDNNREAWELIQNILYYWNHRDILRTDHMADYAAPIELALRKVIYDIKMQSLRPKKLACLDDFTPEKAVTELAETARSHRINSHPLFAFMNENTLSHDEIRIFMDNYYVNNRIFHLFVIALAMSTPLEGRAELAHNFYDEMGADDPKAAHPLLFMKNYGTIGISDCIHPTPESLELMNAKTYASFLCGDHYFGLGGFGYIELTMPHQMRKILSGLEKAGLPMRDLEFWHAHITIDVEHGRTWFAEMLKLIKTPEQAQRCFEGGTYLLDARATLYDGILRGIHEHA